MKKTRIDSARAILGADIIFPDEITKARGVSYSKRQLKRLIFKMFPSEEMLYKCKASNYAVMACPPKSMSILEVRSLKPRLFLSTSICWYEDEKFAKKDKTTFGWLAIRKYIVPNSIGMTWNEQISLLSDEERVPNAGELSWFITTYYEVRNIFLFKSVYGRTFSVNSYGHHVGLGHGDSLSSNCYQNDYRHGYLGLVSAWKF